LIVLGDAMTALHQETMSVLLIEDNPGDARLVEEMFKQLASHLTAEVECVDRLERGLECLSEHPADVILLDLGLPDSNGIDTFFAIQQYASNRPVIVFTGLRDEETAARVLREGAQDYLIKGQIDTDRLLRSVRHAIERKRAEEQLRAVTDVQRLLLSELDHRVRNNLAALLTLIDFGQRRYDSVDRFAESMRHRVQTMATVHTLLSRSQWTSISLERLIRSLIPSEFQDRVMIEGTKIVVPVKQVHAFGMVLHEFITNSIKYGALGAENGLLIVTWKVEQRTESTGEHAEEATPSRVLQLRWQEQSGPRVEPPTSSGVGTQIIEGLARSELNGSVELNYPAEGVDHRITAVVESESVMRNPGGGGQRAT